MVSLEEKVVFVSPLANKVVEQILNFQEQKDFTPVEAQVALWNQFTGAITKLNFEDADVTQLFLPVLAKLTPNVTETMLLSSK